MGIREKVRNMKLLAPQMAASSIDDRNRALKLIENKLTEHKEEIFEENHKDLEAAKANEVLPAVMKRLKFNEEKLDDVLSGLKQLAALDDPLGRMTLNRQLDDGLILKRVTCPIGVIGVIFEARPDALVQISSLCIKSGNCAVLKGGKETSNTNRILFKYISEAVGEAGLPIGAYIQAEAHSEIDELLKCDDCVDLLIPRGSNAFVRYIMDNTRIPVMGHADGICHIFVDRDADFDKAVRIIIDAKTQYTAACNAVETLLVDEKAANDFLPLLAEAAAANGVKLRGTKEAAEILSMTKECETITEDDFIEYLSLTASVKIVSGVDEAIAHINKYGSHHTDAIITENRERAEYFMQMVDSAGVYMNCSTRFADGFRYGFGAEVGISTGKIHARGPVGLEGLTTYKYKLYGDGHIVDDYAKKLRTFKHKNL